MTLELQKTKVSNAVSLILSLAKKETDDVLSDENVPVHLQIGVKKIPPAQKFMKLKLPHAITSPDADVCLFVKDLDKNVRDTDETVAHFEDLFSKKGVKNVKEIIPVKGLKTDYKPYEARWNLSNAYDVFLADERIVACLPRLLGKNFYGRKRGPSQVNILAKDLQKEINRAINTKQFTFSAKGSTSMAVVGHSGMTAEHLTANIMEAVSQISTAIPGCSDNIKQLCIKAKSSTSVPIYLAEGGPQDATLMERKKPATPRVEIDELSTLTDGKVAVFADGHVLLLKDGQTREDAMDMYRKTSDLKRKGRPLTNKKSPSKKMKKTVPVTHQKKTVNKLKKTKRSAKSK